MRTQKMEENKDEKMKVLYNENQIVDIIKKISKGANLAQNYIPSLQDRHKITMMAKEIPLLIEALDDPNLLLSLKVFNCVIKDLAVCILEDDKEALTEKIEDLAVSNNDIIKQGEFNEYAELFQNFLIKRLERGIDVDKSKKGIRKLYQEFIMFNVNSKFKVNYGLPAYSWKHEMYDFINSSDNLDCFNVLRE
jgi:hypothetical protein